MNPKMTIIDAAQCLGQSQAFAHSRLLELNLPVLSQENYLYFEQKVAERFFQFSFTPKTIVFQILKGGTGKTSLAFEFAIRASLYGAQVLCVDLDSQGNLTQAFNQNAEEVPVMVDHLAEGYPIYDSILRVMDGIDLLPSRIENSLLDEIIRGKDLPLEKLYRDPLSQLRDFYDLIIIDCPPSLGQSVAAAALAADLLISPVTPEKFALAGLEATRQMVAELEEDYSVSIPCYPLLNKFELEDKRSMDAWNIIRDQLEKDRKSNRRNRLSRDFSSNFGEKDGSSWNATNASTAHNPGLIFDRISPCWIRFSRAFGEANSEMSSIFDSVQPNEAKVDVDSLTQELLGLKKSVRVNQKNDQSSDKILTNDKIEKRTEIEEKVLEDLF